MDFAYDRQRIERLRTEARSFGHDCSFFHYYFLKYYTQLQAKQPFPVAVGTAVSAMFGDVPVSIGADELIVGRQPADIAMSSVQRTEYEQLRADKQRWLPDFGGQTGHMTIDIDLVLQKGTRGVEADIRAQLAGLDLTQPATVEKQQFYESCLLALKGLVRFANRYADEAERQAEAATAARAKELRQIAANLRRVPEHPAESFYEAVQSAHFVTFAVNAKPFWSGYHLFQLGRPDRYLWPYYEKDLCEKKITPELAQTLLDCFGLMLNTRIDPGLAAGYMVGGRDGGTGHVISNDLTRMCIRSVSHIRMIYPGVGFCWCADTPEEDLRLACEVLGEGHSHPAIFNDEVIARGLQYYGVPAADSRLYIHSTCVEITPIASSNVWVASPYMNLVKTLLEVMADDFADMDGLLAAYQARIAANIRKNLESEMRSRVQRAHYAADPLLSCFVNDCVARGKDIEAGGARYNWIMPSFVGLSNVADALLVMEQLVFTDEIGWSELRAALADNFEGSEGLRQRILNLPKYGNDDGAADKYVLLMTEFLARETAKYQRRDGNALVPSLFCWVMHDEFGRETGASPDGRKAGFPLGDGSGPAQGRELKGPTAAALSSTKWDHSKFIGGVAVNMKFSKKSFTGDSLEKLLAVVKTYLELGGFELQINVVDRETLRKAQDDPDAYQDVIVRIGGYSDYFTRLSPTMQAEVLARTEYQI
jgi:formate C-acetyltransferase